MTIVAIEDIKKVEKGAVNAREGVDTFFDKHSIPVTKASTDIG